MIGQMRVLNETGDITVEWDSDDPESVQKAKDEFKKLKDDGYEFYEAVETKGKRVNRFNKNLGKIIAAPGVKKETDKKKGTRSKALGGGPVSRPAL